MTKKSATNKTAMTTQDAYDRGAEAFAEGHKSVPVSDVIFMGKLIGGSIGSSLPFFDAWLKGWHEANLAAPVRCSTCEQPTDCVCCGYCGEPGCAYHPVY
jgi:hypothetical protein